MIRKLHHFKKLGHPSAPLRCGNTLETHAVGNIVRHVEVWKQRKRLKHHSDVSLVCRGKGDFLTVKDDTTIVRYFQSGYYP